MATYDLAAANAAISQLNALSRSMGNQTRADWAARGYPAGDPAVHQMRAEMERRDTQRVLESTDGVHTRSGSTIIAERNRDIEEFQQKTGRGRTGPWFDDSLPR